VRERERLEASGEKYSELLLAPSPNKRTKERLPTALSGAVVSARHGTERTASPEGAAAEKRGTHREREETDNRAKVWRRA